MTLIKSISGIRGTIGGKSGSNLTAIDIVACSAGFGSWILAQNKGRSVVVGRDARISGRMVSTLVAQALISMGIDVIDLDLSTTPTVEMSVTKLDAAGGIIITASHNPKEWNALKFLNHRGEFISAADGESILQNIADSAHTFSGINELGQIKSAPSMLDYHLQEILNLPLVNIDLVRDRKFSIAVDCINSTGAISIPPLLEKLGCRFELINAEMTGDFAHDPEPLPANLAELSNRVIEGQHDLGIVVDPDVDRLAFVCEDGEMFGEEYTIVALADFILKHQPGGKTVSNLSSTQALKDVTEKHGGQYFASAVGEVNVVEKMKEVDALFGGEGNGGVIYPALHYGRDALVGIALFLCHLAETGLPVSALRASYPSYVIDKKKVNLMSGIQPDQIIQMMKDRYRNHEKNTVDGLKLIFKNEWVHMRKSNTEPIIRVYTESKTEQSANDLGSKFVNEIEELCRDMA